MKTDERFEELLAAYLDGEITEEGLSELHEAVHSSSRWRRRFEEESRLHVLMREALVEQAELQTFHEGLPPHRTGASRSLVRVLTAVAAAITIGAVLLGVWYLLAGSPEETRLGTCLSVSGSGQVHIERGAERFRGLPGFELRVGDRVICDADTQAMLGLVDGSMLSMEPDSRLTLISSQPQVTLEQGEALFEIVERSADMPAFQVLTGQSTVAVLGTVFTLEASDRTQLKVYEGTVIFTRHHDKASVQVNSEQMATTDAGPLTVRELSTPASARGVSIVNLLPTDDVTLDRGRRVAGRHLKVEGRRRTAYLRYVIPAVGAIRSAKLRLTQDIDTGSGTLRFFLGDHAEWTEDDLTEARAPAPLRELAQRTGVVQRREVIEVDVSQGIREPGPITVVITLNKTVAHDIWFGSKESETPPQLILTYLSP